MININSRQKGFSLVELMVSIILGLIIVLALGNIFLASRKTITTANALANTHESTRISFEMMARDIREAGGNPCSSHIPVGNKLNSRNGVWWQEVAQGITGYDSGQTVPGTESGSAEGQKIANTDAIDIHSSFVNDANVISDMTSGTSAINAESNAVFQPGDIALACDTSAAFIFKISNFNGSGVISHGQGTGPSDNCSNVFSYDDPCNNSAAGYIFETDAVVSRLRSVRWYVGANANGTRSLYRAILQNNEAALAPNIIELNEVANNVDNLQIDYLARGEDSYVSASSIAEWGDVISVRLQLDVLGDMGNQRDAGVGGDGSSFNRTITHVVFLRNRQ